MKTCDIYLSGGMSGLSREEQKKWRNQVKDAIKFGEYDCCVDPIFFDPTNYYTLEEQRYKSEREVFEFDLNKLRNSNLVIVNFNMPNSLGTAMELILAKENNIPVIGLNKNGAKLHPWLIECCTRICDNMRELVEYVVEFYLN